MHDQIHSYARLVDHRITDRRSLRKSKLQPKGGNMTARWRVSAVQALADFKLRVRFVDATEGTLDLFEFIHSPGAGVFSPLSDPEQFSRVCVENGACTWPGGLDMAPDAMYAKIHECATPAPGGRRIRTHSCRSSMIAARRNALQTRQHCLTSSQRADVSQQFRASVAGRA